MKQYINTSNYYLGTLASVINNTMETGSFEVDSVENEHVTLPETGFYWLDVDFTSSGEREIFRISHRVGNTLYFDRRISPTGKFRHEEGAVVGLRDFAQLFNMLSSNSDNFGQVEQVDNLTIKIFGGNVFTQGKQNRMITTRNFIITPNNGIQFLHFDSNANAGSEFVVKNEQDPYLFLLAAITTDTSSITGIDDMRGMFIGAELSFLRLDGSTPMEGDLDMNGHKIINAEISGTPVVAGATPNTIAGFDGTKHLISLNPETYPNFTELSYLKGATRNVQEQLDEKGDMFYDHYLFENPSDRNTFYIQDLSTNVFVDHDIRFKAGSDLKEGQQYIARVANTDVYEHLLIFDDGFIGPTDHLEIQPGKVTTLTMLAISPTMLEWHCQLGVTSVNGQTGDVIIDLSSALEQSEESGVGDLVRDTNLWELAPGTYQVGVNEVLGAPEPVRLFYRSGQYFEAWFGCTVSISYNQNLYSNLGNYYTILSGWFIHYGYANETIGTYRMVKLHQNDPVTLTYARNLDIDLNQSLNYTLTLTGDCDLTFGQEQGHVGFTEGCVYQIVIVQDNVGGHRINLPSYFLYASGYAQDTTAGGVSKLIIDYQDGHYFASISRYAPRS